MASIEVQSSREALIKWYLVIIGNYTRLFVRIFKMADINSPVHHLLDCISLKPSQAGNHKCDPGLKFVQFSVMTDPLDLLWNRNVKHFSIYTTFKVCSGGTRCIYS